MHDEGRRMAFDPRRSGRKLLVFDGQLEQLYAHLRMERTADMSANARRSFPIPFGACLSQEWHELGTSCRPRGSAINRCRSGLCRPDSGPARLDAG
jgi:hypothetical protein